MNELFMPLLISAGFGIIGALLRFLVDTLKANELQMKISTYGLIFYAGVALISGAFAGIMLDYGRIGSILAGYAALDLMDGFYTSFKKTKINVKK